jgi:dinuclear metal center YbgI/SA1388 family protein
MGVTIQDIIGCLDEIAPFSMAESWDNVGLLIGDRSREVKAILIGLDPTNKLLDEAITKSADTIITHHPAIFKPLPSIDTAEPSGSFLEKALGAKLNIFSCHTNFDSAAPGVNDVLAELLGLEEVRPLVTAGLNPDENSGLGRIGRYPRALGWPEFTARLHDILELDGLPVAGPMPAQVQVVALCGGSGSEFAELARACGADVYLSAEIKHNVARWAEECGFCIVDGSHYGTEKPAMRLLAAKLREQASLRNWAIDIFETETEQHPFTIVINERTKT